VRPAPEVAAWAEAIPDAARSTCGCSGGAGELRYEPMPVAAGCDCRHVLYALPSGLVGVGRRISLFARRRSRIGLQFGTKGPRV
jgi:hypothetical protein